MKKVLKHKQIPIQKRKELAEYALKNGINRTVLKYNVHHLTAQRWLDRLVCGKSFENKNFQLLTEDDHNYLLSLKHLVGVVSMQEIKNKYSLDTSIYTMARFYREQNIIQEKKYLMIFKCKHCKNTIRVIKIYFGWPKKIPCQNCGLKPMKHIETLVIPFYSPNYYKDFFINSGQLTPVNHIFFIDNVASLLKIHNGTKTLFTYSSKPKKNNRFHIIKEFRQINDNIIPVSYCNHSFTNLHSRNILNPNMDNIMTELICSNCQLPFFRDIQRKENTFPKIMEIKPDLSQLATELFITAQQTNIKMACKTIGVPRKRFYELKKKYVYLYNAVQITIEKI